MKNDDHWAIAAKSVGLTSRQLRERLAAAANSTEYDNCLGWRSWEMWPCITDEELTHVAGCRHCVDLAMFYVRTATEDAMNRLENKWFNEWLKSPPANMPGNAPPETPK